jgi:hypothetical protein
MRYDQLGHSRRIVDAENALDAGPRARTRGQARVRGGLVQTSARGQHEHGALAVVKQIVRHAIRGYAERRVYLVQREFAETSEELKAVGIRMTVAAAAAGGGKGGTVSLL